MHSSIPIKRTVQQESTHKEKILELLILLTGPGGYSQIELARKLGYVKDVFSQIKSGHSNGSPQLLAGLELLREVMLLRKEIALRDELSRIRAEKTPVIYPPHQGGDPALNEDKEVSSDAREKIVQTVKDRARKK